MRIASFVVVALLLVGCGWDGQIQVESSDERFDGLSGEFESKFRGAEATLKQGDTTLAIVDRSPSGMAVSVYIRDAAHVGGQTPETARDSLADAAERVAQSSPTDLGELSRLLPSAEDIDVDDLARRLTETSETLTVTVTGTPSDLRDLAELFQVQTVACGMFAAVDDTPNRCNAEETDDGFVISHSGTDVTVDRSETGSTPSSVPSFPTVTTEEVSYILLLSFS